MSLDVHISIRCQDDKMLRCKDTPYRYSGTIIQRTFVRTDARKNVFCMLLEVRRVRVSARAGPGARAGVRVQPAPRTHVVGTQWKARDRGGHDIFGSYTEGTTQL